MADEANIVSGIVKTYKLTYEPAEMMHALFDKNSARNRWTMTSGFLKSFIDFFSPRTEKLDMYFDDEDDIMTFISFVDGKSLNSRNG